MKKVLTITLIAVFVCIPVFIETTNAQDNQNSGSDQDALKRQVQENGILRQKREAEAKLREAGKEVKKETRLSEKALDTVCAQTAVGARETTLIAALDTFSASAKSALEARKAGLVSAWGNTVAKDRQTARKTAETTYRSSMKSAHDTLRSARKTAWSAFNTEIKKCSGAERYSEQAPIFTEPTNL